MIKWEVLESDNLGSHMARAKVPGGWLIIYTYSYEDNVTDTMTFYPDPNHTWDGSSLP